MQHWLIQELLQGRGRQQESIMESGGAVDAFGRWIELNWKKNDKGKTMPNFGSVMSQVAQSYELQIMLQILPILKSNKQIYCTAWLHDGVHLYLGNKAKEERWIQQITKKVNSYCWQSGIHTRLECEYIEPEQIEVAAA